MKLRVEDWVKNYNITNLTPFNKYIACLYYVVQTVLTVGYGDMTPLTTSEKVSCTFIMLFGVFIYSLMIGNITSYF